MFVFFSLIFIRSFAMTVRSYMSSITSDMQTSSNTKKTETNPCAVFSFNVVVIIRTISIWSIITHMICPADNLTSIRIWSYAYGSNSQSVRIIWSCPLRTERVSYSCGHDHTHIIHINICFGIYIYLIMMYSIYVCTSIRFKL